MHLSPTRWTQKQKICGLMALLAVCWLSLFITVPRPLFNEGYSTLLYASEGDLIGARIAPDGQWRFPMNQPLPDKFKTCLISFEDKRFHYHPGIDPIALSRAVLSNLQAGKVVSGGSTLTMQLARIIRKNQPRTFWQKGIEMMWALYLESTHSKDEILKFYASHAPFGGNVVGLEAAAWRYFGRSADLLSWAECATLAVLPNSPALIHPGRNRNLLKAKRDRLLKQLRDHEYLDQTTYELACMEPLPEAPIPLPRHASHLLERVAAQSPGQQVTTTIHYKLQQQAQQMVNRYAHRYQSNHIYNVAALIADVESGEVLAYVGNADNLTDKQRGGDVDVITAPRSTGSILKPFLYAAMLHDGLILPSTLISDVPLNINGFTPQNYNKTFYGAVPAHVAIERSLNVPLVRMLTQYNTGRFMSLLKQLGMTTLRFPEQHYGASLILGGAEGCLWDLCGMYGSLARCLSHYHRYNGRYDAEDIHPLTFHKNVTAKPMIQHITDPRLSDQGLLSYASVWFMMEAMSAVNRPEEESDWQQFESMKQIAWKTGTSYGGRDAWAIGTTQQYVVGVWVGNASGEGRAGLTGVGYAAPILFDLFALLPDSPWFDQPLDELEQMAVCRKSGHKASPLCEEADTLYMPVTGRQTPLCPYHKRIHLSADGRFRVNSSCESPNQMISRAWFVLPPAQAYYYRHYHIDYQPLPPFKPGCEESSSRSSLISVIYPEHEAILYLPKGFTGKQEMFVFKAAHQHPDATLYWHLDDRYLGETTDQHQMACRAEKGTHLLTLLDGQGNQKRIRFKVE